MVRSTRPTYRYLHVTQSTVLIFLDLCSSLFSLFFSLLSVPLFSLKVGDPVTEPPPAHALPHVYWVPSDNRTREGLLRGGITTASNVIVCPSATGTTNSLSIMLRVIQLCKILAPSVVLTTGRTSTWKKQVPHLHDRIDSILGTTAQLMAMTMCFFFFLFTDLCPSFHFLVSTRSGKQCLLEIIANLLAVPICPQSIHWWDHLQHYQRGAWPPTSVAGKRRRCHGDQRRHWQWCESSGEWRDSENHLWCFDFGPGAYIVAIECQNSKFICTSTRCPDLFVWANVFEIV